MDNCLTTIAFLRAINVGGHVVKMDHLRGLFELMGLLNVVTFLASGNLIFDSPPGPHENLERVIENDLQEALGCRVVTFLRTPEELKKVADHAVFPPDVMSKAVAYNIGFLKEDPSEKSKLKLLGLETEIDSVQVHGRELYWTCQLKQSDSKLSNAIFEKTLGMECTLRGINTIQRMTALISKRGNG